VTREPGEAVAGLTVTLIDARGDVVGAAGTDAAGRYRIGGLTPGTFTLTAAGDGSTPVATTVTLTDRAPLRHDVLLPHRAELRGTVRAQSTGRVVPEAVATLVDAGGRVVDSVTTTADGAFAFTDLPAGDYTLTASGYAPDVQVVRVVPGGTTDVRIALGPADVCRSRDPETGPIRIQPVAGD